jgi:hypothetical protein
VEDIGNTTTISMMTSIRSVLIKSCMTTIQREINQLEHWLNHLPDQGASDVPNLTTCPPMNDISHLSTLMNRLSEQITIQQHTLTNISDRLLILENLRQVHIDDSIDKMDDPWIDNHLVPLSNEIIGDDCISETMYTFNKELTESVPTGNVCEAEIPTSEKQNELELAPVPVEPMTEQPVPAESEVKKEEHVEEVQEVEEEVEVEEVVEEEVEEVEEVVEVVEEEEEVVEEEVEEVEEEVEEVEEEVEEVEEEVEEEEVEEEVVEEEVEEEEEELEEITYLAKKYYKNNEGFIYGIDEDEQPTENPIGYWKEKTKTIAFYKTK